MKNISTGNGRFFRAGEPIQLIIDLANRESEQLLLIPRDSEDIACTCAEKGFEKSPENEL